MKTKEVTIMARDGSDLQIKAQLLLCLECEGDGPFFIYVVDRKHLHFQCLKCDETFCDGSCA